MTDFNSYMGNIDTDFFRELCLRNGELRYYKRNELKVTNQGIHESKIFQGVKIFSRSKLSKDQKSILTQKVYLTPKQNIDY